jgi:hypothetical protein
LKDPRFPELRPTLKIPPHSTMKINRCSPGVRLASSKWIQLDIESRS